MKLNDGTLLLDKSLADEIHEEWHRVRKVNMPPNSVYQNLMTAKTK